MRITTNPRKKWLHSSSLRTRLAVLSTSQRIYNTRPRIAYGKTTKLISNKTWNSFSQKGWPKTTPIECLSFTAERLSARQVQGEMITGQQCSKKHKAWRIISLVKKELTIANCTREDGGSSKTRIGPWGGRTPGRIIRRIIFWAKKGSIWQSRGILQWS